MIELTEGEQERIYDNIEREGTSHSIGSLEALGGPRAFASGVGRGVTENADKVVEDQTES